MSGNSLSRRHLLGSVAGAGLGALAAGSAAAQGTATGAAQRPNILWLVSEDNNPFIGAYGDPLARTPTIDALAATGVLFRNVYSNAPVCAPSRFGILTGVFPESCAPAHQMRAIGHLPDGFRTYPELMRGAGYHCSNNAKTDYNCDVDPQTLWDAQGPDAHWRSRRDPAQPFMAVFNFETTHESSLFSPTPGRVTPDMVRVPDFLPDTRAVRQDIASYYNLMERMDGEVAERLAELAADGLADDTIVFYYSDNGGALPRSKRYCNEDGLRCAMVVHVPAKWQHLVPARPGSEIASPISFIDLAPTVLALAGVAQPPQMAGTPFLTPRAAPQRYAFAMRNRMDERIDFQRTVTDGRWRYIRNYLPHRPLGQHQAFAWIAKSYQDWEQAYIDGQLNADQARFFQPKAFEELYDLAADPQELRNLASEPAHEGVRQQLSDAVDAQMMAIHDNGFLPEEMPGEGWGPSRDVAVYPLANVMALARIAAQGDPAGLPALRGSLASQIEVVRYWAAIGLLILGPQADPGRSEMLTAVAHDPSAHVRIQLAEALVKMGQDAEAVPVLITLAGPDQPWQIRLHALNALTFIGQAAMPALEVARQAVAAESTFLQSAGKYLVATLTGSYTPQMEIFDWQGMQRRMRERSKRGA